MPWCTHCGLVLSTGHVDATMITASDCSMVKLKLAPLGQERKDNIYANAHMPFFTVLSFTLLLLTISFFLFVFEPNHTPSGKKMATQGS